MGTIWELLLTINAGLKIVFVVNGLYVCFIYPKPEETLWEVPGYNCKGSPFGEVLCIDIRYFRVDLNIHSEYDWFKILLYLYVPIIFIYICVFWGRLQAKLKIKPVH